MAGRVRWCENWKCARPAQTEREANTQNRVAMKKNKVIRQRGEQGEKCVLLWNWDAGLRIERCKLWLEILETCWGPFSTFFCCYGNFLSLSFHSSNMKDWHHVGISHHTDINIKWACMKATINLDKNHLVSMLKCWMVGKIKIFKKICLL